MIRHFPHLFVLFLMWATVCAAEPPPPEPQPGLIDRMMHSAKKLNPFGSESKVRTPPNTAALKLKSLVLKMSIDPPTVNLGETRQINVTLRLQNKGKKLVQLEFPTTQRIEVLAVNSVGKQIERWSDDQAFRNEPGLVTINAGERLEYSATISTRDFAGGQEYTIQGFFPNYETLRASTKVVPTR
jgi:Intracellular proteinase inhibitor